MWSSGVSELPPFGCECRFVPVLLRQGDPVVSIDKVKRQLVHIPCETFRDYECTSCVVRLVQSIFTEVRKINRSSSLSSFMKQYGFVSGFV